MNFFGRRSKDVRPAAKAGKAAVGGASGGNEITSTIMSLKQKVETMGKRKTFLEQKVRAEHNKALEWKKKGNKKAALMCLKKKKMYEKEVEKISAVSLKIEHQVITLEGSQVNVDAINTQRMFKTEMEKISKQMNPDKVADLQDDIQEQMDKQEEVNELLSQPLAQDNDEDELLDELDELMKDDEEEEVDISSLNIESNTASQNVLELPSTPFESVQSGQVTQTSTSEEEAALRELEAELAS